MYPNKVCINFPADLWSVSWLVSLFVLKVVPWSGCSSDNRMLCAVFAVTWCTSTYWSHPSSAGVHWHIYYLSEIMNTRSASHLLTVIWTQDCSRMLSLTYCAVIDFTTGCRHHYPCIHLVRHAELIMPLVSLSTILSPCMCPLFSPLASVSTILSPVTIITYSLPLYHCPIFFPLVPLSTILSAGDIVHYSLPSP